jgi:alpha-L-fucosidase
MDGRTSRWHFACALAASLTTFACANPPATDVVAAVGQQPAAVDRMEWWREARFGLFIHWGLYAVPAGRWDQETGYGEWIRDSAHIPLGEYDRLLERFNPTEFDADAWARMADEAGMKYVVITSKHHDGFALFDSAASDFDVMSTPHRRDIMQEIARAFRARGLQPCWYHSIMDWHHPDYLPRRGWEEAERPAGDADMERYVKYLHAQVSELLTNYGPIGVLWFDGEWERTWSHERGQALYDLCRKLQPDVIVNNRVDVGRGGMAGMTTGPGYAGDFGTPEQEVPATGLPGADWESCITMNSHWGWNEADLEWKSTTELVRLLVDVVSKGGNLLLNVGPRADGTFPPRAVERLAGIGRWMKLHGDAIHGTQASPFDVLPWGRCTRKRDGGETRLFLHVLDWPVDGRLLVPGLGNDSVRTSRMADGAPLATERSGGDWLIRLPAEPWDPDCSVIELRVVGEPVVYRAPRIVADGDAFVDQIEVRCETSSPELQLRFRLDGGDPAENGVQYKGPILLTAPALLAVRAFHHGRAVTATVLREFRQEAPLPGTVDPAPGWEMTPGLLRSKYRGDWNALPDWQTLTPAEQRIEAAVGLGESGAEEYVGLRFEGWVRVPSTGMWNFVLESDDGARLRVGGCTLSDLDGLHGPASAAGSIALAEGWHAIEVEWFNKTGGAVLGLKRGMQGATLETIPNSDLGAVAPAAANDTYGALPSPQQLLWHELEYYAFVHFNMNTFTDREWGEGVEDPDKFAPTALDCRQWARVAREAGMRAIILTAKHHDGFCLWDSALTGHDVGSSGWRNGSGDVLRDLSDACREFGLKFGLYLSPWDRNNPLYGTDDYNRYFAGQLAEVLSSYGPVFEVWFDGACGEGPNGRRQVYDWELFHNTVYRHQPDALIFSDVGPGCRWVGNENGFAGETNWCTLSPAGFEPGGAAPAQAVLNRGQEGGTHWIPAECDVSIRPGWYYHADQDDDVKSLASLAEIWYGSVGRGANLLLNLPVDRRGLVHEHDAARLMELRTLLDATFDRDLAGGAKPQADGRLTLPVPATFDVVVLREDIARGQRVRRFSIEARENGGAWRELARGTTIGRKRILRCIPTRADEVRLLIHESAAPPRISAFQLHLAPPSVALACEQPDFLESTRIAFACATPGAEIRYTLDGSDPTRASMLAAGPLTLERSARVRARAFAPGKHGVEIAELAVRRWSEGDLLRPLVFVRAPEPGLRWRAWTRGMQSLDDLDLDAPAAAEGTCDAPTAQVAPRAEQIALAFDGFFRASADGIYAFAVVSDDGSRLWLGDLLVVENDGLHATRRREGRVGLRAGWHSLRVAWFNAGGEGLLEVSAGAGSPPMPLAAEILGR